MGGNVIRVTDGVIHGIKHKAHSLVIMTDTAENVFILDYV